MLGLGVEVALPSARTVCYVEREAYAAAILASRMEAAELAPAPVWSDLATFDAGRWRGAVDCVLSGDPCQPNSVAGKRLGADDDRFLIEQVVRIYADSGARRLFRENVTGNTSGQLAAIVPLLAELGCSVAAGIFRAKDVGASHGRERLFIMADRSDDLRRPDRRGVGCIQGESEGASCVRPIRQGDGRSRLTRSGTESSLAECALVDSASERRREGRPEHELRSGRHSATDSGGALADADGLRRRHENDQGEPSASALHLDAALVAGMPFAPGPSDPRWPAIIRDAPDLEPAVRRMADGLANRVDRLRACGNGVVPLVAAYAWRTLEATLDEAAAGAIAVTESAAA
jgi:DNA (cytosine-5)-methyltransferase 1